MLHDLKIVFLRNWYFEVILFFDRWFSIFIQILPKTNWLCSYGMISFWISHNVTCALQQQLCLVVVYFWTSFLPEWESTRWLQRVLVFSKDSDTDLWGRTLARLFEYVLWSSEIFAHHPRLLMERGAFYARGICRLKSRMRISAKKYFIFGRSKYIFDYLTRTKRSSSRCLSLPVMCLKPKSL